MLRRVPTLLGIALFAISIALSASAQDAPGTQVTVQSTTPVTASVQINIDGNTYFLEIPATVIVDAVISNVEDEARLISQAQRRVGVLDWQIQGIDEYEQEYVHGAYRSSEVSSPDHKLIVVTSSVVNLDTEPFEFWNFSALGFDETGNTYEYEDRYCDDVNPGAREGCTIVFDVPKNVEIVGLDLSVMDHQRLKFTPTEAE